MKDIFIAPPRVGKLVSVAIRKKDSDEYPQFTGVVSYVFDQFFVVTFNDKEGLYKITYDQIVLDFNNHGDLECQFLTIAGFPAYSDVVNGKYTYTPLPKGKRRPNNVSRAFRRFFIGY